ncbi:MAG TPA: aminoacetone oxidase family FAD-binding enzyme [Thermoanaerobaculia bacterium]|nr:aminoacetone oxidase family FAD-binding enzyme [Thermoanaerobaculia bacterium]
MVGAGAAGLFAAIWAARTAPGARVVALDGAARPGAKILVSGGGRCNLAHETVSGRDFHGSSPHAVEKVLRQFDVAATLAFFAGLGVVVRREEGGKLFPANGRARTVLDALLAEANRRGVEIRTSHRVAAVSPSGSGLLVSGPWGALAADRVVLATGGRSLPKSGSDGSGYALAASLGHRITPTLPALVPLLLAADHPFRSLAGLSAPVALAVRATSGRRLVEVTGPLLCTHFGISGPAVLDVSRHLLAARRADPGAHLVASFLPGRHAGEWEELLSSLGPRSVRALLAESLPPRLAEALCRLAGVEPATPGYRLRREARRALVRSLTELPLPVEGDRGFVAAEVTAGGVPLAEIDLRTMASRRAPALHLCGEICDVDGRLGGFNFQWAWSSGQLAGLGAARALEPGRSDPGPRAIAAASAASASGMQ